jgi:hypothetical protein
VSQLPFFLALLPFFGPMVAATIYATRAGYRYETFLEARSDYRRPSYIGLARWPSKAYREVSAQRREANVLTQAGTYGDEGRDLLASVRRGQKLMVAAVFVGPIATVLLIVFLRS